MQTNTHDTTLVIGGHGKTGRRVAERLLARGLPVRAASRSTDPPFDWEDRATWAPALSGATSAYVTYYPDLAVPGAPGAIAALAETALDAGTRRIVLLSGRGEVEAEHAEQALAASGAAWTVVRCSWFSQNFTESYFLDSLLAGELALPAGDVPVPFVDADDIADVAVAALTEPGHEEQVYELTGPRPLTFADAVAEIARASGRPIRYVPISVEQFAAGMAEQDVPGDLISLLTYLFTEVLVDDNADVADGVRRALGREPRDFAEFARRSAAAGAFADGG